MNRKSVLKVNTENKTEKLIKHPTVETVIDDLRQLGRFDRQKVIESFCPRCQAIGGCPC